VWYVPGGIWPGSPRGISSPWRAVWTKASAKEGGGDRRGPAFYEHHPCLAQPEQADLERTTLADDYMKH